MYDNIGNITSVKTYGYTTGDISGDPTREDNFTYHSTIKDRLTKFNNISISYDSNGCPSYYDKNYAWTKGKLSRIYKGSAQQPGTLYEDCVFTYDAYGRRLSKSYTRDPNTASTSDYSYTYNTNYTYDNSGRLIRERCVEAYTYSGGTSNTRDITYLYDESSIVGAVQTYNGTTETFYFDRNIKGDVIGIFNSSGTKVASYSYDAWGNCTTKTLVSNNFSSYNPIRYRGYYYDRETKLYYLNARYYNPEWRRFISPDSTDYIDPDVPNGLNLYAYCNNDPVNYADPSGHSVDIILDIASVIWSAYDFIKDPSLKNAGWLAMDVVFAVVPFLTGSRLINAASKLDNVAYIGKGINKFDNMYKTVVLGNKMDRVVNMALDIGATFYNGYEPLNYLMSIGMKIDDISDTIKYAAKLDNARFIIDKFNDGYKFIHVGKDARPFFEMIKSAYGMELRLLYRLKIGNRLHKIWWLANSLRRIYDR